MADSSTGAWCVQVRPAREVRPVESFVDDLDVFLAAVPHGAQYRFTHRLSGHLARFRDVTSCEVSPVSRLPFREFGWRFAPA